MPQAAPALPGAASTSAFVHLSAGGVDLLLDVTDGRLPAVVHWGAPLGALTPASASAVALAAVEPLVGNTVDIPIRVGILPEGRTGWTGRPGVNGHRDGRDWSPAFTVTAIDVEGPASVVPADVPGAPPLVAAGVATLVVDAADTVTGLAVRLEIAMLDGGLVRTRATLTNTGRGVYTLDGLLLVLPVPGRAREVLDFGGRWAGERTPQRSVLHTGIHDREGRKGRTGPDAATVLSVGVPGFGFADGEVWGVHVGWSGNHRHWAERLSTGAQVIGGGELLLPGEIRLGSDRSYRSPWVYGAYGVGLDDQAARFHRWLRARPTHPTRPRPVTLNVWEAVYFDHDLARLTALADRAAAIGVERFVLDDGWFRGRRDDTAGLGDWFVDEQIWPDGLHPLTDHVTALGMEFGLWFEPEMVNEDSDLARAHPDWIMQTGGRLPVRSRNQQVLDLAIPAAREYITERMTAILAEYPIAYVKWDHNRDLVDAGEPGGTAAVHAQTLAAYAIMDTLRERFPGLEIESCSSGGARVDLGVIEHTDRVWVSDCIDPLERQRMNRWTMQLLPPELLGSHVGSPTNHTTGRTHALSFRAGTALFGHFGIEWDITTASEADLAALADWIALYREVRPLLHTGDVVRVDQTDPTLLVYGTVAVDRRDALFFVASVGRSEVAPPGRVTFRGLDPALSYRVTPLVIGGREPHTGAPPWWGGVGVGVGVGVGAGAGAGAGTGAPGLVVPGSVLLHAGVQAPASYPERVVPFRVTAV